MTTSAPIPRVNEQKLLVTYTDHRLRVLLASLNRVSLRRGTFSDRLRSAVVRELEHRKAVT